MIHVCEQIWQRMVSGLSLYFGPLGSVPALCGTRAVVRKGEMDALVWDADAVG